MEEKIVDFVTARVDVPREQVEKVVQQVMEFLKENPQQLTSLLGEEGPLGDVGKKLGGLFGRG